MPIRRRPGPAAAGSAAAGLTAALVAFLITGCAPAGRLSRAGAVDLQPGGWSGPPLARTVRRPGGQPLRNGTVGGTWVTSITGDPRTFNLLAARDSNSLAVIGPLFDTLARYDPYTREFKPNLASFRIDVDAAGRLTVTYTLRDDLYWTTPGSPRDRWVRVTSDDVVFWYNEVEGDKAVGNPAYRAQFVQMPDGSRKRIEIEKLDDRSFVFHYPRVVSDPILSTNMEFGPRYLYEPAKRSRGVHGMLDLFSTKVDPRTIPSIGPYRIVEYTPGRRVVLQRNPAYWKKDGNGTSYPYIERVVIRIVPDQKAEYLLFRRGIRDSYEPRADELSELLAADKPDFTVYDGGESLGAAFFTFNQNPAHLDPARYRWFSQARFRQAMSSLVDRKRIVAQVYHGLAAPAEHFFSRANPFYDQGIRLQYTYDPARARRLLAEIGIKPDSRGRMTDAQGNPVDFDIEVEAGNDADVDTANIFADELARVGIAARVRPLDAQKLVEMLISTYDWQCAIVSLGSDAWPESGSSVWLSSGSFHVWRPLQEKPATDWEARADLLYNEGRFTLDREKRDQVYDEYQRLMLEQLPVIYTVHPLRFAAVRNKWDNVFFDTLGGLDTLYVFLKP